MTAHITKHRTGFDYGFTSITEEGEEGIDTGISLGILHLRAGESLSEVVEIESAFLVLSGSVEVATGQRSEHCVRRSLFDQYPFCLHVAAGTTVRLQAEGEAEIAICRVRNTLEFPEEWYLPETVSHEDRGAGLVGGTCRRWVRTIFDDSNAHPNCQLVLGEGVNMPGCWSNYPPQHHPQPAVMHYRFADQRGYGHAELGEQIFRIRGGDTVKITHSQVHTQCSAPGYGMWFLWAIRHLPGQRYTIPELSAEHAWILQPNASYWRPKQEVSL